jgi:hypothetical protein
MRSPTRVAPPRPGRVGRELLTQSSDEAQAADRKHPDDSTGGRTRWPRTTTEMPSRESSRPGTAAASSHRCCPASQWNLVRKTRPDVSGAGRLRRSQRTLTCSRLGISRVELNGTRSTLRKSRGGRRNPPLPHEAVDYAQGVPPTRAATAPRPAQRIARRTFTGPLSLSRFFCQTSRSEDGLEYSRKKSSCLGKSQHMSTIRTRSASA